MPEMASTPAPYPPFHSTDWGAFDGAGLASPVPTAGSSDHAGGQSPDRPGQVDQYDPFSPSISNWQGGQQNGLHLGGTAVGVGGAQFESWSGSAQAQAGTGLHQVPIGQPISMPQLNNSLQNNHYDHNYALTSGLTSQAELQVGSIGGIPFDASWLPVHAGGPGWSEAYSPPNKQSAFPDHSISDWTANQLSHASFASMADGRIQTALAQAGLGSSCGPQWPPIPNSSASGSVDPNSFSLAQLLAQSSQSIPTSIAPDFTFTSSASSTPLYTPSDRSISSPGGHQFPPLSPTNAFGSPLSATYPLYPEANQASFGALHVSPGPAPALGSGSAGHSSHGGALPPPSAGAHASPTPPPPGAQAPPTFAPSPSTSADSGSPAPSAGSSSRTRRSISSPSQAVPVMDPHHPAIARVAANRLRSGLNKAASSDSSLAPAPAPGVIKEKAGKVTLEVQAKCGSCAKVVAILSCRGKREDLGRAHKPEYLCLECSPKRDEFEEEAPIAEEDKELKYATTISAVLDRLAGLELAKDEARPRAKPVGIGRRRRTEQEGLPCDVCARILGSGMTVDLATREAVSFAVEVICPRCASRYKRCSDCGGGGGDGGRIGPGRWRSKELFEPGRKVCKFSHRRQGSSDNMLYETWSLAEINELPAEQGDELRRLLRTTYVTFMLATLAIPEQLEAPGALARNFTECLKINEDHWAAFESVLSQDIEQATGIRRYIGLRWSLATVRKAPKEKGAARETAGADGFEAVPEPYPDGRRTLIPQGRILASFSAGEIELETGSMFQSLNFPKGIGEVYDQGSASIQRMIVRIERDIAELNRARAARGQELYPRLSVIWGMYMYKRSIPFLSRRGERRGFKLLDEYLALFPEDKGLFPPARPCYVPTELLAGWEITARKWGEGDDMTIPVGRNRRVDKAVRPPKVEEVF